MSHVSGLPVRTELVNLPPGSNWTAITRLRLPSWQAIQLLSKPCRSFPLDPPFSQSAIVVGVRDCPYGMCCPWVRGGWDLDALGKFFRRRPRPLLLDKCSNKVCIFSHFSWKMTFWDIFYLEGRFWEMFSNCFPPLQGGSRSRVE